MWRSRTRTVHSARYSPIGHLVFPRTVRPSLKVPFSELQFFYLAGFAAHHTSGPRPHFITRQPERLQVLTYLKVEWTCIKGLTSKVVR